MKIYVYGVQQYIQHSKSNLTILVNCVYVQVLSSS